MASRTLHSIRALPATPGRTALPQGLRACQLSLPRQSSACGQYVLSSSYVQARVFARCQSTSQGPKRPPPPGSKQSKQQPLPSLGAVIRQGLDFSKTFSSLGNGGFRKLFRDSPGELLLAIFA
ncbi:hypothetical protein IMZ48_08310 [Candidatus Bathyarchaeota archaeon]|nr:hypothetical protein [Candidatus Bathyarchaeota archaeon]